MHDDTVRRTDMHGIVLSVCVDSMGTHTYIVQEPPRQFCSISSPMGDNVTVHIHPLLAFEFIEISR